MANEPQDLAEKGESALLVERIAKEPELVKWKDGDNTTLMHFAAQCGHAKVIEVLTQHGSEVDALNRHGATPLHLGVRREHEGVVRALVRAGASREKVNAYGQTPLEMARRAGNRKILDLLEGKEKPIASLKEVTLIPEIQEEEPTEEDGTLLQEIKTTTEDSVLSVLARPAAIAQYRVAGVVSEDIMKATKIDTPKAEPFGVISRRSLRMLGSNIREWRRNQGHVEGKLRKRRVALDLLIAFMGALVLPVAVFFSSSCCPWWHPLSSCIRWMMPYIFRKVESSAEPVRVAHWSVVPLVMVLFSIMWIPLILWLVAQVRQQDMVLSLLEVLSSLLFYAWIAVVVSILSAAVQSGSDEERYEEAKEKLDRGLLTATVLYAKDSWMMVESRPSAIVHDLDSQSRQIKRGSLRKGRRAAGIASFLHSMLPLLIRWGSDRPVVGRSAVDIVAFCCTFVGSWFVSYAVLAVVNRGYKDYAWLASGSRVFSYLTNQKMAHENDLPHIPLDSVKNVTAWLRLRNFCLRRDRFVVVWMEVIMGALGTTMFVLIATVLVNLGSSKGGSLSFDLVIFSSLVAYDGLIMALCLVYFLMVPVEINGLISDSLRMLGDAAWQAQLLAADKVADGAYLGSSLQVASLLNAAQQKLTTENEGDYIKVFGIVIGSGFVQTLVTGLLSLLASAIGMLLQLD